MFYDRVGGGRGWVWRLFFGGIYKIYIISWNCRLLKLWYISLRISLVLVLYVKGDKYWYKFVYVKVNIKK